MKYYCEEKDLVIRQLDSGENGLSQAEAERRLAENGKNKLAAAKKRLDTQTAFEAVGRPDDNHSSGCGRDKRSALQ